MSPIYLHDGTILVNNGALAVSEDCCCGGAENTCNGCDPPIPDTLYVTFPSDLTGCFSNFAENTYELSWSSTCRWMKTLWINGERWNILTKYSDYFSWYTQINWYPEYYHPDSCIVAWTGPTSACDPSGAYTYEPNMCGDGGCSAACDSGYSCTSVGNATVSYS